MKRQKFSDISFGESKVLAQDCILGCWEWFNSHVREFEAVREIKHEIAEPLKPVEKKLEEFRLEMLADLEERRRFNERNVLYNRLAELHRQRKLAVLRAQMAKDGLKDTESCHPDLDRAFVDIWKEDLRAVLCIDNEILYVQEKLALL